MSSSIESMLNKRPEIVEPIDFSAESERVERAVDDYILGTGEEEATGAASQKKVPRELEFSISWDTPTGKLHGKFKNKILTTADHITVGVLRSRLTGGVAVESLDGFTSQLAEAIAHCTVSLSERPKWAQNLASLVDPRLILAIYKEVDGHEATFQRS